MRRGATFAVGIIAGVVVILCVLSLLALFLATRPIPVPVEATEPSTQDLVVSLDEAYLTRIATVSAESDDPVIQRVIVDVKPESRMDITIQALVEVIGLEFSPSIQGVGFLEVNNGQLSFVLQKIQLGGIGVKRSTLPSPLLRSIEEMEASFNEQMNQAFVEGDLTPVGVSSDESSITITFKSQ